MKTQNMKSKQKVEQLYDILDAVFGGVNLSQKRLGTGKSYSYSLKATPGLDKDDLTPYNFTVKVRELGHAEVELQTIPFSKPKEYDKFRMESEVMMAVLTIIAETAFMHWAELGKILNVDTELQQVAKNS